MVSTVASGPMFSWALSVGSLHAFPVPGYTSMHVDACSCEHMKKSIKMIPNCLTATLSYLQSSGDYLTQIRALIISYYVIFFLNTLIVAALAAFFGSERK